VGMKNRTIGNLKKDLLQRGGSLGKVRVNEFIEKYPARGQASGAKESEAAGKVRRRAN